MFYLSLFINYTIFIYYTTQSVVGRHSQTEFGNEKKNDELFISKYLALRKQVKAKALNSNAYKMQVKAKAFSRSQTPFGNAFHSAKRHTFKKEVDYVLFILIYKLYDIYILYDAERRGKAFPNGVWEREKKR